MGNNKLRSETFSKMRFTFYSALCVAALTAHQA